MDVRINAIFEAAWWDFPSRCGADISPLITNSVVGLGNQGVICWVYVFVNSMGESIELGVCRVMVLVVVSG